MTNREIIDRIQSLKKEKNAVILAHYYTRPEVQDIADYLGDSLGLSQEEEKLILILSYFAAYILWQKLPPSSLRIKRY